MNKKFFPHLAMMSLCILVLGSMIVALDRVPSLALQEARTLGFAVALCAGAICIGCAGVYWNAMVPRWPLAIVGTLLVLLGIVTLTVVPDTATWMQEALTLLLALSTLALGLLLGASATERVP